MEVVMERFQLGKYFQTISRVLMHPKEFYAETATTQEESWSKPLWSLILSAAIFSMASVISGMHPNPVLMGMIFLINAVGMVFIFSTLGYGITGLLKGPSVSFLKIFSIYAYSSAAVLVLAWMPFMLWITEIWRWWLIGYGLVKGCGISIKKVIVILSLSVILLVLFFQITLNMTR
ncbi:MAG: hypothetical protein FP816_13295 [Desulfobacteraceae bacterium]|nr:hypothetical protein [Desulfobacteraceae bacterium]